MFVKRTVSRGVVRGVVRADVCQTSPCLQAITELILEGQLPAGDEFIGDSEEPVTVSV